MRHRSGQAVYLLGGGLSGGGLEVGGGLFGGGLDASGGLQGKARFAKASSCWSWHGQQQQHPAVCEAMHMRYLSGLARQRTCRVEGSLEVGLRPVAGCKVMHGEQKHHCAGDCMVSSSNVELYMRQGHAHEAHTCQVEGYPEAGLVLVAGCKQRHDQ